MKEKKIIIYCALMCVVTGATTYWLNQRHFRKIAVVDAVKLFDGFNMKNELQGKEKTRLESLKKQVDSVENLFQLAKASQDQDKIKHMAYAFNYMKANLENEFGKGNKNINDQVWKRLNPMLDQYGKEKKLHLIIGANGMGSVLYTDEYMDLTTDLVKYVNKRYEEGN